MYVQALIQYTVFDDAVALLGRHGASLFVVPFVSDDTIGRFTCWGARYLHQDSARYSRRDV